MGSRRYEVIQMRYRQFQGGLGHGLKVERLLDFEWSSSAAGVAP